MSQTASLSVLNLCSHHICIGRSLELANCLLGTKIISDVQGCKCPYLLREERLSRPGRKRALIERLIAYVEVALSNVNSICSCT